MYPRNSIGQRQEEHIATPENTPQLLEKEREERGRERQQMQSSISDLRAQIDDLKTDRDHWRQQATALLTHQPDAPTRKEGRAGLWLALLVALLASAAAGLFGYWWTTKGGGSPG